MRSLALILISTFSLLFLTGTSTLAAPSGASLDERADGPQKTRRSYTERLRDIINVPKRTLANNVTEGALLSGLAGAYFSGTAVRFHSFSFVFSLRFTNYTAQKFGSVSPDL